MVARPAPMIDSVLQTANKMDYIFSQVDLAPIIGPVGWCVAMGKLIKVLNWENILDVS